jgi:DNA polymerase III delta subunit
MRFTEALRELQQKKSNKFVLYGEEIYLKESFIKNARLINTSVYDYYPGEETEAKSLLFSRSLYEEDQTVILHYFDEMKPSNFKELISGYEGLLVVILSEEANIKLKSLTEIIGLCTPVTCAKMPEYGPDYTIWITTKASEQGYTFVEGAENELYKRVGTDMLLLFKELEKLMIFNMESKTITLGDVEKVVGFSIVGSSYEILDLLLKRDVIKALEIIDIYLKNEDIGELLFFLGHYFEKMYRMVLMNGSGINAEGIASILGMNPFLVRSRYLPRALSVGKEKLAQWIANVVDLEVGLRSSFLKDILISKFIFSFK